MENRSMNLIRINQVLQIVGVSRSHWYALIKNGQAPKPVKLSERVAVWVREEVLDWIQSKVAEREQR